MEGKSTDTLLESVFSEAEIPWKHGRKEYKPQIKHARLYIASAKARKVQSIEIINAWFEMAKMTLTEDKMNMPLSMYCEALSKSKVFLSSITKNL